MDNYRYCAEFVAARAGAEGFRALDYGCGRGRIVGLLRARNIEAFGCDVFYAAGGGFEGVPEELRSVVLEMDRGVIPFPDAWFDVVVSNQVLEHVEDLDAVLAEIGRVLKPGGTVLSVFPHRGVWREGHKGIPWLHRFPKGPRLRRLRQLYAAAWRMLGFGYFKAGKSVWQWSGDACAWLDAWTHYRDWAEIDACFGRRFRITRHLEEHWLQSRLEKVAPLIAVFPVALQRLVAWKLGGLVLVSSGSPLPADRSARGERLSFPGSSGASP